MAFGQRFSQADLDRLSAKNIKPVERKPVKQILHSDINVGVLDDNFRFEDIIPRFIFNVKPCPAPRMTQSDKWKTDPDHPDEKKRQRPAVHRYFEFKHHLKAECRTNGYNLEPVLNILFVIQMPDSWSEKKRKLFDGKKHQSRPDRDNYLKAFQDSFEGDDGYVWDGRTIKIWGRQPKIVIF